MKVDEALCRDCEKGVKEINVKRITMYNSALQCQYIVSVCACLCVSSCTLSFCSDYLTNGLSNLFIVYALRCCRCTQQPDRQICVLCAVCCMCSRDVSSRAKSFESSSLDGRRALFA